MDDHLDYLNLFLEAGGNWEEGGDGILKLLCRLEEHVGGGSGNSNDLDVVVGGEVYLGNQFLGENSVEVVVEGKRYDIFSDSRAVFGHDGGPLAS